MAGHLNQEIGDYEPDLKAGILTNSVKFGKNKMYFLSFSFFSLSSIYLYLLSLHNTGPREWGVLVLISYPFYLFFFYATWRKGISFENISRFRNNYRLLLIVSINGLFANPFANPLRNLPENFMVLDGHSVRCFSFRMIHKKTVKHSVIRLWTNS